MLCKRKLVKTVQPPAPLVKHTAFTYLTRRSRLVEDNCVSQLSTIRLLDRVPRPSDRWTIAFWVLCSEHIRGTMSCQLAIKTMNMIPPVTGFETSSCQVFGQFLVYDSQSFIMSVAKIWLQGKSIDWVHPSHRSGEFVTVNYLIYESKYIMRAINFPRFLCTLC